MMRRPPRSTRTDTLFPYTTLFRSQADGDAVAIPLVSARPGGEAQDIGPGQRLAFDIAEHPVQRRVLVEIAAAIDDAVAGAMLQGNAPLPPPLIRHHARKLCRGPSRRRVCQYVSISAVAVALQKNKQIVHT